MKILLTGANGMLGGAVREYCTKTDHECIPFNRAGLVAGFPESAFSIMDSVDLVIHAAANTDVEACERNPDQCYEDNFLLTESLAKAAAARHIKMVYISSTGVYGTAKDLPFCEYDEAKPTTHHHRSKLIGEEVTLSFNPRNLVIRTGWIFGGSFSLRKNFVARRIDEGIAANNGVIQSNNQQFGNPTYNVDLVERIFELLNGNFVGIFNCVNEGTASRHQYVSAIMKIAGIDVVVEPTTASSFNRLAKVSNNESATNWKADRLGLTPMPLWQESLANYIACNLNNPPNDVVSTE